MVQRRGAAMATLLVYASGCVAAAALLRSRKKKKKERCRGSARRVVAFEGVARSTCKALVVGGDHPSGCEAAAYERLVDDFVGGDEDAGIVTLGLDAEWVRNGKVALVQLSSRSDRAVLVRMKSIESLPRGMLRLLESDDVFKIGVGIMQDAKRLWRDHGVLVRGCVDARDLWQELSFSESSKGKHAVTGLGLTALATRVLGKTVDVSYKSLELATSDWEAGVLPIAK